jgi:hypothetical protein
MALASNPIEILVQRRLTSAYLKAEPIDVVFQRPTMINTPAGGMAQGTPTPIPAQRIRLIPFKRRLVELTRDTPDGNIIKEGYVVMGEPDLDIQAADEFTYNGGHYEVVSIEPNRSYRTIANATYRGEQVDGAWGD